MIEYVIQLLTDPAALFELVRWGGYVALVLACERLRAAGVVRTLPVVGSVAAVSAGLVDGRALLDLAYDEDHRADVDLNVVMTGKGRFVEVQGTGERTSFSPAQLDQLLALAREGVRALTTAQRQVLRAAGVDLRGIR